MSLANKYRPKSFDTIIGQDHITGILKAKIKKDSGGNSNFILFGPRGTGKTSSARILAKAMNCLDIQDGNPCNQCANCKIIEEGKTLDYVEIDAASHTGVDNIREEVIDKAAYPPTMLKKKIYVIDEVHMLSKGAFNALLKTIEEPKDTMAFILATTEIQKVPETIISRCQVFNFRKIPEGEMVTHLQKICASEGLAYDANALSLVAKISEGCVRDAVKYVDQVSILGNLNEENVTKFLGIASEESIKTFIEHIVNKNSDLLFAEITKLSESGVDLQHFAKQVLMYLDAHLFENVDLYLNISEQFGEILSGIRNYPYPALMYKIILHKHISGKSGSLIEAVKMTPAAPIIPNAPVKVEKQESMENPVVISQNPPAEKAPIQTAIPEPTVVVIPTPVVASAPLPQSDHAALWNRVIDNIEKESVKKNLKDLSSLSSIQDTTAHIMVINRFAQMALENHDNRDYVEQILSAEYGSPLHIKVTFQSKEDFFADMMG